MEKQKDLYYFAGTHWDREWYQTYQGFRYRLVEMLNDLVKGMEENPELGVFHLDGQTVVLDDYAEIEPQGAERLRGLIEQGRVKAGPWYVMPDEFLVSGESLIRNLMLGHRKAKEWGAAEAWKFGYVCDIFGHIAQLPQIFQGFGIPYSLFCRGFGGKTEPYFLWRAPDGSECINFRLGDKNLYGEFCLQVIEKKRGMERNSEEESERLTKEYAAYLAALTEFPVYVVMDALDHMPLHRDTPKYLKWLEEALPDTRVHQTDLAEAGGKLAQYRDRLRVVAGEMNRTNRDGGGYLISHTLSSHYPLKRENDRCQNRLEKVIEPILAYASMNGVELNRRYAELAYQYLLQNHPHDSICGCSIDQVHKDMEYRFDQVRELCDVLEEAYLSADQRPYLDPGGRRTDGILSLYNPLPFAREEVVEADLTMKRNYPSRYAEPFGYEPINSFRILDYQGQSIPYQIVKIRNAQTSRIRGQHNQITDVYTVAFRAQLPPGGRAEYRIVASETPVRYLRHMRSGIHDMENEYLRVTIADNGALSILDKKTGERYDRQLLLADDSEIGDGWYHAAAVENRTVYSFGLAAQIEKIESGVRRCVFRITKELRLPSGMREDSAGKRRAEEEAVCRAAFEVGLSQNARQVDVKLTVDNRAARDHRLRLAVPTGRPGDTYFAGQAFYCCERRTGIDYDTASWLEPDSYEKAMNGIVGKRDQNGTGLALVSAEGLHECAGLDDAEGSLMITLLRAFRRTVSTNGESRGQLNRMLTYRFSLVPLDRTVQYADLVRIQDCLAAGILTGYREAPAESETAAPASLLLVEGGGVCTSAVKCAEEQDGSVIVRVFNASAEATAARITFAKPVRSARRVNLNEEPEDGVAEIAGNTVSLPLGPWKIATVQAKL